MTDQRQPSAEAETSVAHPVARLVALVALGGVAIGLALVFLPRLNGSSAAVPAASAAVAPPAATPPTGSWLATPTSGLAGTSKSVWVFKRVCKRDGACATDLVRHLPGGMTDEAQLIPSTDSDGKTTFTATFPAIESECENFIRQPGPHPDERAAMSDQYMITWRLTGYEIEAAVESTGQCSTLFDANGGWGWTAIPLSMATPPQPSFAGAERSDCLGLQTKGQALGAPSKSDVTAWLGRAHALLSSTLAKLAALHPPRVEAAVYDEFLAALRSQTNLLSRMRAAAIEGQERLLVTLDEQLTAAGTREAAAAKRAGFECEPTLPDGESESSLPNCQAVGITAAGGKEGACIGTNLNETGAAINVVRNAGQTLQMPGYNVRLLATRLLSMRVNPDVNTGPHPGVHGWLVSFEIAVTNTGGTPLAFDTNGADTELELPYTTPNSESLAVYEWVDQTRGFGTAIAELDPIAPHATSTGWISYLAPDWTPSELHQRGADLLFVPVGDTFGAHADDTSENYLGDVRLWKWANPAGRASLGLPATARIPANPSSVPSES